jgi:hypothetical protein
MNISPQIAALIENAPAAFDSARATYEMAKADAEAPHDGDLSDDECSLLGTAQFDAATALFLTPATDFAALAYKMEVFEAEEYFALIDECRQPAFEALIADVRRLGRL